MKGNSGDPGQRGLPGKDGSPGDPGEEGTPGQQVNKINGTNMAMVRSQPIYHSIPKFCWKGSSKNVYLRSNYIHVYFQVTLCGSSVQKSNIILLQILIALLCSKRSISTFVKGGVRTCCVNAAAISIPLHFVYEPRP